MRWNYHRQRFFKKKYKKRRLLRWNIIYALVFALKKYTKETQGSSSAFHLTFPINLNLKLITCHLVKLILACYE